MYAFEPRFPLDHTLSLIRLVRAGEANPSKILIHVGAITGEVGALLAQGPIFSMTIPDLTFDEACAQIEALEFSATAADPAFDPTPYIPLILLILEWIMKRRG